MTTAIERTPLYVKRAIRSAYGSIHDRSWAITCNKAQNWLTNALGLTTDYNRHEIDGSTVNFCWKTQMWRVEGLAA